MHALDLPAVGPGLLEYLDAVQDRREYALLDGVRHGAELVLHEPEGLDRVFHGRLALEQLRQAAAFLPDIGVRLGDLVVEAVEPCLHVGVLGVVVPVRDVEPVQLPGKLVLGAGQLRPGLLHLGDAGLDLVRVDRPVQIVLGGRDERRALQRIDDEGLDLGVDPGLGRVGPVGACMPVDELPVLAEIVERVPVRPILPAFPVDGAVHARATDETFQDGRQQVLVFLAIRLFVPDATLLALETDQHPDGLADDRLVYAVVQVIFILLYSMVGPAPQPRPKGNGT